MKERIYKLKDNIKFIIKDNKYLLILIMATILLIMGIFGNSSYYKGHDTQYHASVISSYAKQINISEGKFFPTKILPEIANNFGYGTGIFYSQLPHLTATYIYKLIHVMGLNVYWAMKTTHAIVLILSSITMYFLANKIVKSKKIALISSLILLITPFRISEILIRDAFAECFTYIFIPMILLGIFELIDKNYKKFIWLFTLGYIGLLWSHQVLSLYVTLLTIPIYIYHIKELLNKKTIMYMLLSGVIIVLVVLTSVLPMVYHKLNGQYVVFDGDSMGGYDKISKKSLVISDLIIPTNSGKNVKNSVSSRINFNINIIVIILCGMTIYYFKKINIEKKDKKKIKGIFLVTIIALWMTTRLFPWKLMPDFMYMIQFPWRLLTISCITISIFAPLCLKMYENDKYFSVICMVVVGLFLASGLETISWHYEKNIGEEKNINPSNYGMGFQKEYLPVNTLENIEYFNKRNQNILIESGNANIEITLNKTPDLQFNVYEIKGDTVIELPRLFYYGYTLTNKTTGEIIELLENENGFVSAKIQEEGNYTLKYTGIDFINIYKRALLIGAILILIYILVMKCILRNKFIKRKK